MRWPINASGRVDTVLNNTGGATANSVFVAGVAISPAGKLQLDTAAIAAADVNKAGLRKKPAGILRVSTSAAAIAMHHNGLPMTSNGQLVVEANGVPVRWVAGIPISASGRVCVSTVT